MWILFMQMDTPGGYLLSKVHFITQESKPIDSVNIYNISVILNA